MRISKSLLLIIGVVAFLVCIVFIMFFLFPFLMHPSKPQITVREFPFRLTYELNSEVKTIEDIITCEFDGYGELTTAGQSREWNVSTKGDVVLRDEGDCGSLCLNLLDLSNEDEYDEFGNKILNLYFYGGNGHYYMSDELGNLQREAQELNKICYKYEMNDGTIGHSSIPKDVAIEKYQVRLINWQCDRTQGNTGQHK